MATGLRCMRKPAFLCQHQVVHGVAIFPLAHLNLGASLISLLAPLSSSASGPLNIAITPF